MNTLPHAGSHPRKKSAAAAPFKKSLIFLAVASALCSTAAASPSGWSSVNLKPIYGNDTFPALFDETYGAGQNENETDGVIGIAAFNNGASVKDFSASLTLNRNNVAASAYTVLLNRSPVTFTGSTATLRMTTIDGENQSEEDPDHAGSALLIHGDLTDPGSTFNASETTKVVFAADTTTLASTLEGVKAGSTNTLHLEGNSAVAFTGKTVNITTLTESDSVGQFLHRGATPTTGIGIVLESYSGKNSAKSADTANIRTGRETTLNISVTGTGTTTPTEDTENFFQEGGAALLAGIYADGGELWAEGDVNIDVNAKGGTAAGMMLYARALDHSTFSELNGTHWEFTNFGNSVSYDHTSTFEKSLTLNVHSDTGRTVGMLLAGPCCNLEGINGEWDEEDGYTDNRDPQATTRVTVNDLTVNVTKGDANKFASDGILFIGTRVGGTTELYINGNAAISADNALRSDYWAYDGVVGDGDVKAKVEVGEKAFLTLNGNVSSYAGDFIQNGGTVTVKTTDKQFFGGAVKVHGGTFTTNARFDSTGFETNPDAAPSLKVFDGADVTVAGMTVGRFDADRTAVKLYGGSLTVNGDLNITEDAKIGANAGRLAVNEGTSVIAGRLKTTVVDEDGTRPETSGAELYVKGGTLAFTDTADVNLNDLWLTNGAVATVTQKAGFRFSGPVIVQNATLDAPAMDFVSGKNGRLRVMDGGTVNLASLTLTRPAGDWTSEADVPASAKLLSGTMNVGSLTVDEGAHLGLNTGTFTVTGGDSVALGNINTTHVNAYENGQWTTSEKRPAVSAATFNMKGGSFTLGSAPTVKSQPTFRTGHLNVTDGAVFKNHGNLVLDDTLTLTGSAFHNQGTAHGKTLVLENGADWYAYEATKEQKANGVHFAEHFATMIFEEGSRFISEEAETPEYLYIDQGNNFLRGGQIYRMAEDGTAGKAFEHLVVGGVFEGDEGDAGLGYPNFPLIAFEAGSYAFTDAVVGLDEDGQSAAGTLKLAGSTFTLTDSLTVKEAGTVEISGGKVSAGSMAVEGGSFTVTGGETTTDRLSVAGVGTDVRIKGESIVNVGTLAVNGGSLMLGTDLKEGVTDAPKLTVKTITIADGAKMELVSGTLSTTTDQIFTNGVGADGTVTDAGEQKFGLSHTGLSYDKLALTGGTLAFSDAFYNDLYVQSAAKTLNEKSKTTLVFNGERVDGKGSVDIDDIADNDKTVESNVAVKIDADETGKAEIDKSFGVSRIELSEKVKDILIKGKEAVDKIIKLVGSDKADGELIDGENLTKISVGEKATLQLGESQSSHNQGQISTALTVEENGTLAVKVGDYTLANVTAEKGQVNIEAGKVTFDKLTTNEGALSIGDGASVAVSNLTLKGNSQIAAGKNLSVTELTLDQANVSHTVTGGMTIDKLAGAADNVLVNIGTEGENGARGDVTVKGDSLAGLSFFLDPAYVDGQTIADGSRLMFAGNTINGKVAVGQNAYVVLGGTDDSGITAVFNEGRIRWGNADGAVLAAAYVASPVTIDSTAGGLLVDGRLTRSQAVAAGSVTFAANSALVADVTNVTDGTALITANAVTVEEGSKAVLVGTLRQDATYALTSDADANLVWADNLIAGNALWKLTMNDDGTIGARLTDAAVIFGDALQGTTLANAGMASENDYVNKLLTDESGNIANRTDIAARFDAAMNPAGALTTFTTAYDRASELRQTVREESAKGEGSRLWAHVSGGKTKLKGIRTGGTDLHTKTNAYGLTVGGVAELENVTLGAAFAAGTGDTKNRAVSAKDDFDFYGLSLYGKTSVGAVDLLADASATVVKSDLTVGGAADVDTDVTTSVYSFGVQGQTTLKLAVADVTPFIGANVYHVRGGSYSNGHGAHTASSNATAVEFPVGATVSKAFETASGLAVSPALTLAVVPTVGNRDIDSKVTFAGAESTYNFTFTDDVKVRSKLGVEAAKGNFRFGLNAGYEWGNEERSSAALEARLNYRF